MMRNILKFAAVAATVAVLATPALAYDHSSAGSRYAAPVVGAVVGTAVGVGLYNGWYGTSGGLAAVPTTAAGAAVVGGVVGVGTVALIDAAVQPCRGFQAVFGMNRGACANGEYTGYNERPHRRMR